MPAEPLASVHPLDPQEPNRHPRAVGGSAHGRHTSTRRVRDILRASIASGLTFSHDGLTEDFLVRELGASRNSVREALQMLSEEGLLDRRRRVGTSVAGSVVRIPINDIVAPAHGEVKIRWVERRVVPASAFIREALRTDAEEVGMIEHLFLLFGQPVGVRSLYFDKNVDIVETPVAMTRTAAFPFAFGSAIGEVETVVEATTSDAKTSRLLGVAVGSPVLVRQQIVYDVHGEPREIEFTHFRADRVSLSARHAPGENDALTLR
jgi:GntR family transcriptional regulator